MLIVGPNKDEVSARPAGVSWISWLVGLALLAGVLAVAIHVTEERAFIELTKQMEPWWLLLALTLQAFTYVTQGAIWRAVARAVGVPLKFSTTFALSVAKLFIDQAIPSAGISGTLLEAKAFEKRGMPPHAVKSGIIINIFSFYAAFVLSLALALGLLWFRGVSNPVVVSLSALFIAFGAAFGIMLQTLVGRRFGASSRPWGRWRVIRTASATLAEADPVLVRDVRLELKAIALQFGTMLLDTSTIWVLLHSVGAGLSIDRVFASLMIASLIRTAGFVPGGLGTFEATLVLMLTANGATVPSALSVTLLFRGFSFWLPMAPGFFLSRRAVRNPRG